MILTLLLIAQVGSDWVEISQQHYQKPLRVTHNHPSLSTIKKIVEKGFQETTPKNRIYINQSVADYQWNRGVVHKVPNIGSVGRVFTSTENNHPTVKIVNKNRFDENINRNPVKVATEGDIEKDLSSGNKLNDDPDPVMLNDIKNKDNLKLQIKNIDSSNDQLKEVKGPDKSEKQTNEKGETTEYITNNCTKANTFKNIVKFLKVVADTIKKNTRKSVNSKIKYLHDLKDSILANIEERIENAWPEVTPPSRRRRRSTSREHVQSPSSESTLMTISFLTFAVFLIKLVLQVIQTYKSKTMMMAPAIVAMGRAVNAQTTNN